MDLSLDTDRMNFCERLDLARQSANCKYKNELTIRKLAMNALQPSIDPLLHKPLFYLNTKVKYNFKCLCNLLLRKTKVLLDYLKANLDNLKFCQCSVV